jgi:O-antigen/teichoic acid export membrane protein
MLGMNVVLMYANIVLLGYLTGSEAVGVFKVASSLAALVAFPSTAVNLALAPTIAHLFALGDFAGLQRHATTSARAVLLMSLPIFAVFVLYGDSVLLLFGSEFVSGNLALTVMSFGYVINIFAGASGYLLIMTKHERTAAILFTIGAALSVVLGYALIPLWGLDGAAVAMAISIGLVSAAFIFQVHRKLRIRSVAFPFGQLHDNNRQDARLIG